MAERSVEEALREMGRARAPEGFADRVTAAARQGDRHFELETPIGRVRVAASGERLVAVSRAGSASEFEDWVERRTGRRPHPTDAARDPLAARLGDALAGGRPDLGFDLAGLGEFERAVLMKALEIPRGEYRTYAWVAREIGRPRAVRAVGTALARNPIPLFIPCHRVVRTDGRIGNYGLGGPAVKRALLAHEGADVAVLREMAAS